MSEDRIANLEMHVTEQQKVLDDLSDVMMAQQKLIDRLAARLTASDDRIAELEAGLPDPVNEKPPHY